MPPKFQHIFKGVGVAVLSVKIVPDVKKLPQLFGDDLLTFAELAFWMITINILESKNMFIS